MFPYFIQYSTNSGKSNPQQPLLRRVSLELTYDAGELYVLNSFNSVTPHCIDLIWNGYILFVRCFSGKTLQESNTVDIRILNPSSKILRTTFNSGL